MCKATALLVPSDLEPHTCAQVQLKSKRRAQVRGLSDKRFGLILLDSGRGRQWRSKSDAPRQGACREDL